MSSEQRNGDRRHLLGLFGADFAQHGIARAPFHQRDERPGARPSHHQVDFPIADATFFLDDSRSLVNADPVFNLPSPVGFSIAFLALLLTVPQMAIQRTARLAIRLDVLVDALRTQPKTVVGRQPTRNLLGTPLLTQTRFDALNDGRRHLGRLGLGATTRQRFLVGLMGPDSRAARDCAATPDKSSKAISPASPRYAVDYARLSSARKFGIFDARSTGNTFP